MADGQFDFMMARNYDFMNPLQDEEGRQEANFFLHYALRGSNALDVGAGTGRIAIQLAERGLDVVCLDSSSAWLDALLLKIASRPELHPRITAIAADPGKVVLNKKFSLAYMFRTLFYIVEESDRLNAFRNVRKHLAPDGLFIVDAPLGARPEEPKTEFCRVKVGMNEYVMYYAFTRLQGEQYRLTANYETRRDGVVVEDREWKCTCRDIMSHEYLVGLLNEAGYEVRESFADPNFTPLKPGADHGFVVARNRP